MKLKNVTSLTCLNYNEKKALEGIIKEIENNYPLIKKIILYGSKARGDFLEESDVDILMICKKSIPREIKMKILDMIYGLELSYDVVFSVVFLNEKDFENKLNTFIMSVKKEGILIWSRE